MRKTLLIIIAATVSVAIFAGGAFTLYAELVRQTREIPATVTVRIVPSGLCGDVNEDDTVNVFDAITTLRIIVGKLTSTPLQVVVSDVVRDGNTDIFDVILMLRHIVGKAEITGCGPP